MIQGLKFGFWVGFITFLVLSVSAAARAETTPSRSSTGISQSEVAPPLLFLSAAVNEGTSSLSNPTLGSTANSGSRTEVLLLATLELGSFVLEGGGGWMHDSQTGTAQPTGFNPTKYELVTDAAIAELTPRVRVVGGLEVGPTLEMLYGDDVSFAPGLVASGQSTAWLVGGQALYRFKLERATIRAGARYVQSLDIPGHKLQSVQATLQFGLPVL